MLNALKEVHLILSQGAHSQFGDLPPTARIEMLMQQWLLSRPEFREFLPTRVMVAYPEPWMDRVDAMKKIQGWTDTSVMHFHNLAVFGEQILLSIRYGAWSVVFEPTQAFNFARFWRPQIQGYIHAYRAVTGVELGAEIVDSRVDATHAVGAAAAPPRVSAAAEPLKPTATCSTSRRRCTWACATGADRSSPGTRSRSVARPPWRSRRETAATARELAALVGCAAGLLLPSTLHLFWDLLGVLRRPPIEIYMDAATYPIARWSAETLGRAGGAAACPSGGTTPGTWHTCSRGVAAPGRWCCATASVPAAAVSRRWQAMPPWRAATAAAW